MGPDLSAGLLEEHTVLVAGELGPGDVQPQITTGFSVTKIQARPLLCWVPPWGAVKGEGRTDGRMRGPEAHRPLKDDRGHRGWTGPGAPGEGASRGLAVCGRPSTPGETQRNRKALASCHCFLGCTACRVFTPAPGMKSLRLQWRCRVLTPGTPGKSQDAI